MRLSELTDRRVGLLGFGAEGRSTLEALKRAGHRRDVLVLTDAPSREAIALGIPRASGPAAATRVRELEVIVKSPGIKPWHPVMEAAARGGVKVTTATNIFLAEVRAAGLPVVGVTGSKGKSTTTSLIHLALVEAGRASALVGNIGAPALDALDDVLARRATSCFEMSSYQCHELRRGPDIAVILNLFPEHMDWHGNLEAYYDAKRRIAVTQQAGDLTIFDAGSPEILKLLPLGPGRHVGFGEPPEVHFEGGWFRRGAEQLFNDERMLLKGLHNRRNACAALTVLLEMGLPASTLERTLATFRGLPHRIEEVPGKGGIRWIEDSISTAPEAAVAALEALSGSVATLIAGGHYCGYDFTPLVEAVLREHVRHVICMPESGLQLAALLRKCAASGVLEVHQVADLDEAVAVALRVTPKGSTCLLSPASPSYGAFANFEERAARFRKLIAEA